MSLSGVSVARAEGDRFRLIYTAPAGCSDERSFVQRVAARIGEERLTSSTDESAPAMVVQVSVGEAESSGRIEFPGADNQSFVRTVSGGSCDEVVSGLALIAALSIEALATTPPRAEAVSASPRSPEKSAAATPARPIAARSLGFGVGAFAGIDSWSTPGAALALGVFGELAWRSPLRFARLAARRETGSGVVSGREATFTTWAAQLDACPLSFVLVRGLEAPACANVQLGQLSATGTVGRALPGAAAAHILWASLGASLGFRWQPGASWSLEMAGNVGFPLVRHQFIFRGPEQTVYEVPLVGFGGSVGVGASF
jgi:hypothetical protein